VSDSFGGERLEMGMLGWLLGVLTRPERRVYCWRCGRFVRGLSEWEYAGYQAVFAATKRALNAALDRGELDEARRAELVRPLEEACRRLSGEEGLEPSHLFKHRLSSYGPPCRGCGRNLRTQVSSAKPSTHAGWVRASRISRSRCFFSVAIGTPFSPCGVAAPSA
jgi:hypothetical protein